MPTYARGDYVKVEFQDETTVIGEWMWMSGDRQVRVLDGPGVEWHSPWPGICLP